MNYSTHIQFCAPGQQQSPVPQQHAWQKKTARCVGNDAVRSVWAGSKEKMFLWPTYKFGLALFLMLVANFCFVPPLAAQGSTVRGTIVNDQGTPVTAASVVVKETNVGAATDTSGVLVLPLSPARL